MTTFGQREESFERHMVHDEEMRFRAVARRDRRLGRWAADKLGLSGAAAEDYENALIALGVEEAGEGKVFRKIRNDFDATGIAASDHQIQRQMNELLDAVLVEIRTKG